MTSSLGHDGLKQCVKKIEVLKYKFRSSFVKGARLFYLVLMRIKAVPFLFDFV